MSQFRGANLQILDRTCAILLFGVPNKGMSISHWIPMVEGKPNERLVRSLSQENSALEELDRQFSGIIKLNSHIRVFCFYETDTTPILTESSSNAWTRSNESAVFVEKASAKSRHSQRV